MKTSVVKISVSLLLIFPLLCVHAAEIASFPLHTAAMKGEMETVRELIGSGTPVDTLDDQKRTPLMLACQAGHPPVVSFLLSQGASLYLQDTEGNQPIHFAAMTDNPAVTNELLQQQADTSAVNLAGLTPMDVARNHGNNATLAVLEYTANSMMTPADTLSQAEAILADPNSILAALKENPSIAAHLATIQKSFKLEESAWMSLRSTNASRLARAVITQITKEFDLVVAVADQADANNVSTAMTKVSKNWQDRFDYVGKRIREQARQTNAPEATPVRTPRRRPIPDAVSSDDPTPQQEEENLLEQSMSEWINTGTDNRGTLCIKVKEEYMRDIVTVRNIAKSGNYNDAVLLIDSLMLFRSGSLDNLVTTIEERRSREALRSGATGQQGESGSRGRVRR